MIDVQNDMCHPEGIYAKKGLDITWRQQAAHNTADFVKTARRYKVPIIFIRYNYNKWIESPAGLRHRKDSGPPACLESSWGEQFYAVQPEKGDAIVSKHRYSAFIGTDLDMILRSQRITTLIVTGGGTPVCVESTVRDGFMLDYNIVVVSDCCGTTTKEQETALKRMSSLCGTVLESREILIMWSGNEK